MAWVGLLMLVVPLMVFVGSAIVAEWRRREYVMLTIIGITAWIAVAAFLLVQGPVR